MICAIDRALLANVSRLCPTCVPHVSHFQTRKTVKKQHRVPVSHLNAGTLARIRARARVNTKQVGQVGHQGHQQRKGRP